MQNERIMGNCFYLEAYPYSLVFTRHRLTILTQTQSGEESRVYYSVETTASRQ